jgi:hypothetical protein
VKTPIPNVIPNGIPPLALYPGSDQDLVGQVVKCQGWGRTTIEPQNNGGLHFANLLVTAVEQFGFRVVANAFGQLPFLGDSGGSCFLVQNGKTNITGIMSVTLNAGDPTGHTHMVGMADVRDWVSAVVASLPTVSGSSPARGGAGTVLHVQGTNLAGAQVTLDDAPVAGTTCSATECTVPAPGGQGSKRVGITVSGDVVAAGTFVYEPPPACTYGFSNAPWAGDCDGALAVDCPTKYAAWQNQNPNADPVTVYKGASLNGPWKPFWNVSYYWTPPTIDEWPKVTEADGATIFLMACTGDTSPGDCDAPVAVKVTRYSCSTCTPVKCDPNKGPLCGHAPDGCGGFIECGTCPDPGSTCQDNHWCSTPPCTTAACKCVDGGGIWSDDSQVCVHCKTQACKCAATGGSWNGHSCE